MNLLPIIVFIFLTACAQHTPPIPANDSFIPSSVSIDNAQVVFYDITGSTEYELRKAMDQFDRRGDAYTAWHISWTWKGYGEANCDLSSATVSYDIKVTMPRWIATENAPPELIVKWERYIENLLLHEKGHVDNIVQNYHKVTTAIQKATCATAEFAAQGVLEQFRNFDINYDRETQHGATQGAVFP